MPLFLHMQKAGFLMTWLKYQSNMLRKIDFCLGLRCYVNQEQLFGINLLESITEYASVCYIVTNKKQCWLQHV